MPQEYCVLNCYSCNTYQVHIVKKSSKKWVCKLCGEKQTIIKIFGQGSSKDCREHVQKLNMMKGMLSCTQTDQENSKSCVENELTSNKRGFKRDSFDKEDNIEESPASTGSHQPPPAKTSKWACFLDSDSE